LFLTANASSSEMSISVLGVNPDILRERGRVDDRERNERRTNR